MKTRICIYARVSTQGQDYQRQLTELREYAERMNYEVVREFSEKISGAKTIAERQALTDLLDFAATNHIDKVLVYECSRISRRAIDFLQVIEQLTQMKVSVYILQNGLETLMADGSVNPIAQLVLGIIGQFNSMERSLIRSRMSSGYKVYRANGGKVGRREGYRKSEDAMRAQYNKEMSLLRKGISLRNVQSITGTSVNTLRKLREIL
ncbi:MAG: recombinase family protein [Paludibacteraceae bacterium]|nr:recombinase family protein [Paludibacteraceae bacterium]